MTSTTCNVHTLAFHKVSETLGPARAHDLLGTFLADQDRTRLTSPSDLAAFGERLEREASPTQQIGETLRRYAVLLSTRLSR